MLDVGLMLGVMAIVGDLLECCHEQVNVTYSYLVTFQMDLHGDLEEINQFILLN